MNKVPKQSVYNITNVAIWLIFLMMNECCGAPSGYLNCSPNDNSYHDCVVPDYNSDPGGYLKHRSEIRDIRFEIKNGKWYQKCFAVFEWSEPLHHHETQAACDKIGDGWRFSGDNDLKNTIQYTNANDMMGDANACYSDDKYFWVGGKTNVWLDRDWDDSNGNLVGVCNYRKGDGVSSGDTTCYKKSSLDIDCEFAWSFMSFTVDYCYCETYEAKKTNECMVCGYETVWNEEPNIDCKYYLN
eukprot:352550_1